jgi:two-component system OmpR family sensor kinase
VRAARVIGSDSGVDIRLTADSELPYAGDEAMLRRLVLNLLDNAIRHSPRGATVEVAIRREASGYDIAVRDTGDGIPADARTRIFDRFYQVDAARTRGNNGRGAGLGLPIARWVAEAHGGSLILQRSDASGSIFVVTLPFSSPSA